MAEYQQTRDEDSECSFTSPQQQARQIAEVLTAAYLDFRAAAPDMSIDEVKASGERGYCRLLGIDVDGIDEDLDYELRDRDDFRWSMREDRD